MFGFVRDRIGVSGRLGELVQQLDGEEVILTAEKVGVVQHIGGYVPGIFSSSSAARYRGAFVLTSAGVLATLRTGTHPHVRVIDSGWDLPRGPAAVTISSHGLQIDIALRGVDPAFSGSMTLTYHRAIADDLLRELPATQLRCPIDPVFVYRAAGVRPRS